jgi:hypothetical protein
MTALAKRGQRRPGSPDQRRGASLLLLPPYGAHPNATFTGLTPGKTYWFRVRAFLRDGTTTDYVHPVSLMVI